MALDATKIKVAGTGSIWKAPAGTTLPSDSTTAYASGFLNLGWISDGGFQIDQSLKTKGVNAWQSIEVVRMISTSLERSVSFEALESNKQTIQLAWNGTVTPGSGGAYSMSLTSSALNTEFILGIDWSDGTTSQRIVFPRAVLKSLPKIKYTRQDAVTLSLEIQALQPTDGSASVLIYGVDSGVTA